MIKTLAVIFVLLSTAVYGKEDGIYIAVGNGLHKMSSNDGIKWGNHEFKAKPAHNQLDLKYLVVGDGIAVAVGGYSKSNILVTLDGVKWEQIDFNIGVISGVVYEDGRFLAVGEGGRIAASEDGFKWKEVADAKVKDFLSDEAKELGLKKGIKSNLRAWRVLDGKLIGSGDNGFVVTTDDLKKWEMKRLEPQSRMYIEVAEDVGAVLCGDRSLHFSSDGDKWEEVGPKVADGDKFFSITHDGNRFLVNSKSGRGWESTDGKVWEALKNIEMPGKIKAVSPDMLYSFAASWRYTDDLKYSTDGGKKWKSAEIPGPVGITNIVWAPGFPKF